MQKKQVSHTLYKWTYSAVASQLYKRTVLPRLYRFPLSFYRLSRPLYKVKALINKSVHYISLGVQSVNNLLKISEIY